MSCNYPEALAFGKGGKIILTKNDVFKIRNGHILQFVFHALQFKKSTITFLVANSKHMPNVDSKYVDELMKIGDTCPIPINEKELAILKTDQMLERKLPCNPVFEILVLTSKQWHNKAMEQYDQLQKD